MSKKSIDVRSFYEILEHLEEPYYPGARNKSRSEYVRIFDVPALSASERSLVRYDPEGSKSLPLKDDQVHINEDVSNIISQSALVLRIAGVHTQQPEYLSEIVGHGKKVLAGAGLGALALGSTLGVPGAAILGGMAVHHLMGSGREGQERRQSALGHTDPETGEFKKGWVTKNPGAIAGGIAGMAAGNLVGQPMAGAAIGAGLGKLASSKQARETFKSLASKEGRDVFTGKVRGVLGRAKGHAATKLGHEKLLNTGEIEFNEPDISGPDKSAKPDKSEPRRPDFSASGDYGDVRLPSKIQKFRERISGIKSGLTKAAAPKKSPLSRRINLKGKMESVIQRAFQHMLEAIPDPADYGSGPVIGSKNKPEFSTVLRNARWRPPAKAKEAYKAAQAPAEYGVKALTAASQNRRPSLNAGIAKLSSKAKDVLGRAGSWVRGKIGRQTPVSASSSTSMSSMKVKKGLKKPISKVVEARDDSDYLHAQAQNARLIGSRNTIEYSATQSQPRKKYQPTGARIEQPGLLDKLRGVVGKAGAVIGRAFAFNKRAATPHRTPVAVTARERDMVRGLPWSGASGSAPKITRTRDANQKGSGITVKPVDPSIYPPFSDSSGEHSRTFVRHNVSRSDVPTQPGQPPQALGVQIKNARERALGVLPGPVPKVRFGDTAAFPQKPSGSLIQAPKTVSVDLGSRVHDPQRAGIEHLRNVLRRGGRGVASRSGAPLIGPSDTAEVLPGNAGSSDADRRRAQARRGARVSVSVPSRSEFKSQNTVRRFPLEVLIQPSNTAEIPPASASATDRLKALVGRIRKNRGQEPDAAEVLPGDRVQTFTDIQRASARRGRVSSGGHNPQAALIEPHKSVEVLPPAAAASVQYGDPLAFPRRSEKPQKPQRRQQPIRRKQGFLASRVLPKMEDKMTRVLKRANQR